MQTPTQSPGMPPQPPSAYMRTPEQRKQEWRLILLITAATLAALAVLFQCGLDITLIGRLGN